MLYYAIKSSATVVLTGNGADELFLGYQGNEDLLRHDIEDAIGTRRPWWRAFVRRPRSRSAFLANYQAEYVSAYLGEHENDISRDQVIADLLHDIQSAEVSARTDLYTFMSLFYYTRDGNYRLPDIAGLRAQVEVRSPFLDHRMVEFAASLPVTLKIGDPTSSAQNKLLPKSYFASQVPGRYAWSEKMGMSANVRYDKSFASDREFKRYLDDALAAIVTAGLDASRYQEARRTYTQEKSQGVMYPSSAGMMMAGLMLGRWLMVKSTLAHRSTRNLATSSLPGYTKIFKVNCGSHDDLSHTP